MTKEFWDFDENINFTVININNNSYKVINKWKNYNEAGIILDKIHQIIYEMCLYLNLNYYRYSNKDKIAIKCFCDIHPNNYKLSEMQLNTDFNGINKPRELYLSSDAPLGSDKKHRAKWRHVFLTLRKRNGEFKSFNTIMRLVIHEIAHTMCNHIRWRDDDHNEDFEYYEKLLESVYKKVIN